MQLTSVKYLSFKSHADFGDTFEIKFKLGLDMFG